MDTYLIPYYYTFSCHSMKMYKTLDLVLKSQCDKYTLEPKIQAEGKNKNFHVTGLKSG